VLSVTLCSAVDPCFFLMSSGGGGGGGSSVVDFAQAHMHFESDSAGIAGVS